MGVTVGHELSHIFEKVSRTNLLRRLPRCYRLKQPSTYLLPEWLLPGQGKPQASETAATTRGSAPDGEEAPQRPAQRSQTQTLA